jgi:hypothetical protein
MCYMDWKVFRSDEYMPAVRPEYMHFINLRNRYKHVTIFELSHVYPLYNDTTLYRWHTVR